MTFEVMSFSSYDLALPVACTIGAVVGSFAQAIVVTISPDGPPDKEGIMYFASPELQEARGGLDINEASPWRNTRFRICTLFYRNIARDICYLC